MSHVLVGVYRAHQQVDAVAEFQDDAASLSEEGYHPVSQSWAQGQWGGGAWLVALLLCIVLIGLLVFVYMLIVKPDGTLTVTYELADETALSDQADEEEWYCTACGADVDEADQFCRACGGSLEVQGSPPTSLTGKPAPPATKVCPHCAEEVKAAALVCRFCRYEFGALPTPGQSVP